MAEMQLNGGTAQTETPKAEVAVKKSSVVVLNSGDTDAIIADATKGKLDTGRVETPVADPAKPTEGAVDVSKALESPDAEDEDGVPNKLKGSPEFTDNVKKTIGKKHRQAKEAEELAESVYNEKVLAEKRAEKLEREVARLTAQAAPPKAETPVEPPKREDFKTEKEFIDASVKHEVKKELAAYEAVQQAKAQEDRQREIVQAAGAKIAAAREVVPDFQETLDGAEGEVSNPVAAYMQESDLFAEMSYHLAKNPDVLEKINKMSFARQLVEIGKIESTLKPFGSSPDDSKVKTAKPSLTPQASSKDGNTPSKARAPAPIAPLDTASSSQVEGSKPWAQFKEEWAEKHGRKAMFQRKRH